ncbi:MAG: aspartate--tRNA ligase [Bacillales bacterium]|nr:aspartate--tRNA ligase [Bacillales bacterium]
MLRTHNNGELRLSDVGKRVTLIGWVAKKRNLGSLVFIDLRDRWGYTQVILQEDKFKDVALIKNEYIIQVTGIVTKKEVANKKLPTGEIEVSVEELKIVNSSELTPFIIADETDALEDTRLKYRYLDLRRPIMQKMLMNRAKISKACHNYLDRNEFVEVETPILCLSTPEGARDYIVPSRTRPGSFYALPQSPQLFKQLLMVGGMEKYYQIARCFRDEDLRADRQPDFTQVDVECSFMSQDDIMTLGEGLIAEIWKEALGMEIKTPFRRFTYDYCIDTYGSDKPDTRFDIKLHDISSILKTSEFEVYKNASTIRCIVVPSVASKTSRKVQDNLDLHAKKFGIGKFGFFKYCNGKLESSLLKFINEELQAQLVNELALKEDDLVIVGAGNRMRVCSCLGALRCQYGKDLNLYDPKSYDFLWVVEFPLFDYNEETKEISPCHHPFTKPLDRDVSLLDTHPEKVYAAAYDIVINGYEAGGGSLRIFDQTEQKKIFELLGFTEEKIQKKFGWFVGALKYGVPPHGGFALGLDRVSMLINQTDNIRDVIAFPKNLNAVCPMSNAPMPVDEQQLEDLKIKVETK